VLSSFSSPENIFCLENAPKTIQQRVALFGARQSYLGDFSIGMQLFSDVDGIIQHVGFAKNVEFSLQQLIFIVYLE